MRWIPACLVAISVWTASSAAYAMKVAVVDVPRALQATPDFPRAKAFLEGERDKRTSNFDEREASLKEQRQKIDAKKAVSTADAVAAEERAWMADVQKLNQAMVQARQQLLYLEQGVNQRLIARIQAAVQVVATQQDIDFVVDTGAGTEPNVVFYLSAIDITNDVVKVYKERFKDQPLSFEDTASAFRSPPR
ncbi:MAG: OmpH family outer membrane protein [Myxococcota bacterium]